MVACHGQGPESSLDTCLEGDALNVDSTTLQIAIPAGTLVVGFASSYILERIKARREPSHRISWEATTERGIIETHPDLRGSVTVSYKGEKVDDLTAVSCRVSNTGNRVVKNELVRFEFPVGCKVLDAQLDPVPQREMSVIRQRDREADQREVVYSIGHLERLQEITIKLLASGRNAPDWMIYAFNDVGDVDFQRRDVSRQRKDKEHVAPFLTYLVLMLLSYLIIGPLTSDWIVSSGLAVLELIMAILISGHLIPMARWVRDSFSKSESDNKNSITGIWGNGRAVQISGNMSGDIHVQPRLDSGEAGEEK